MAYLLEKRGGERIAEASRLALFDETHGSGHHLRMQKACFNAPLSASRASTRDIFGDLSLEFQQCAVSRANYPADSPTCDVCYLAYALFVPAAKN